MWEKLLYANTKGCEELVMHAGVNSVYAHVNRNDGPALALFQKLGFEVMQLFVVHVVKL